MSQWRGRLEENTELERAVDWVQRYYHLVIGALLLGFMLWNRVRPWDNFVVDGEVLFNGNDAWYHYRATSYTVRHWPQTMPFDPWTYFPIGNASGQFGTLLDQLAATAALIVGLGSPTDQTIAMVVLFTPAVVATLIGIPTYVVGRRLGGRLGGIVALTVLALSAGAILQRSVVGFSDHHIAEALFQSLGVLGVMVAVSVARRDKPVYEQFVARDVAGLRETLIWSALAGFAITLYLWVWPFGVLLIGIIGVYLLLQLTIEFMRGESPEHTAIMGTITFGVTGILMLIPLSTSGFTVSDFSLLHPIMAWTVAGGCVFMAWLARQWDERDLDTVLYPVAVVAILVAGTVFVKLALPSVFNLFANNIVRIFGGVAGIDPSDIAGTVGEISPMRQPVQFLYQSHGFAAFVALIGGLIILARNAIGSVVPPQRLLVVVWAAFVMAASLTQARFAYYLVVPIAGLTAYVTGNAVRQATADLDGLNVQMYHVITMLAVVLVVVAPMLAVGAPTDISRYDSPGQGIQGWSDGLDWMNENTPAEGTLGGADNEMEYYGTYPKTDDHDYQAGQYGVMSWWDYGHWITTQGERIPNANPFQQGSVSAANFLLAPNETQANDVLDDVDEEDAGTRYVAIDWKMAETNGGIGGKFFAPPNFYSVSDVSQSDYYGTIRYQLRQGGQLLSFNYHTQMYYNSTVTRLYRFHGSAVEPQPMVTDWNLTTTQDGRQVRYIPPGQRPVRTFQNMSAARAYARQDSTSVVGGIGGAPAERVPAMEHYRLVGASERSAKSSGNYERGVISTALGSGLRFNRVNDSTQCSTDIAVRSGTGEYLCVPESTDQFLHPTEPQWVKFFERVPGATIEGTGPANATISTSVEMYNPTADETFTYRQQAKTDENGAFTMTVPYSTTGYDEFGPENGYTNVSVRANSSYRFQAVSLNNETFTQWSGTTDVPESAVLGVDQEPVTVDLEAGRQIDLRQNQTTGNEGANATDVTTETAG